jgi:predicted Zn-dependent protease
VERAAKGRGRSRELGGRAHDEGQGCRAEILGKKPDVACCLCFSASVQPLEYPELFSVQSAQGWLELGNFEESARELEKLGPELQHHPDVLEVRWEICARQKQWQAGAEVARDLIRLVPERHTGWIDLSYALHELQQTQEAWDNLFGVAGRFPKVPIISYNLACYACQLGKLWEAEQWLKRAFHIGDAKEMKEMALSDADLKPLRSKIKSW